MKLEFSFKYKDFEIKACPKRLARFTPDEENETINLVKWATRENGEKYCYSLAYFTQTSEGYELTFVGGRPFECIDIDDLKTIWLALSTAQKILDDYFCIRRLEND